MLEAPDPLSERPDIELLHFEKGTVTTRDQPSPPKRGKTSHIYTMSFYLGEFRRMLYYSRRCSGPYTLLLCRPLRAVKAVDGVDELDKVGVSIITMPGIVSLGSIVIMVVLGPIQGTVVVLCGIIDAYHGRMAGGRIFWYAVFPG